MSAVTIHDVRDGRGGMLAVDLIDVLRLVEPNAASSSRWLCRGVECTGGTAAEFQRVAQMTTPIAWRDMLRLAQGVQQVLAGDFYAVALRHGPEAATEAAEARPWLIVRASAERLQYVVVTEDARLLNRVRERFRDVRDAPEEAPVAQMVDAVPRSPGAAALLDCAPPTARNSRDRAQFRRSFVVSLFFIAPVVAGITFLSEFAAGISAFGPRPSDPLPLGRIPLPGGSLEHPLLWGLNCLFWSACLSGVIASLWVRRDQLKSSVHKEKGAPDRHS